MTQPAIPLESPPAAPATTPAKRPPTLLPEKVGAFLTTHRQTTVLKRDELTASLTPIQQISTSVRLLVIQLQGELHEAEMTAPLEMRNKFNFMHTRLKNFEDRANEFFAAARQLSSAAAEVADGFQHDEADLIRILDILTAPATTEIEVAGAVDLAAQGPNKLELRAAAAKAAEAQAAP